MFPHHLSITFSQKACPQLERANGRLWTVWVNTVGILSSCLFNFYAEYIMRNAGLDEAHTGIKTVGRNINLRYAVNSTLTAESEDKLKNLLMKVEEESEKLGFKLNIKKTKIMASGPITSWQKMGK